MRSLKIAMAVAAVSALALPADAAAHVTLQPNEAPAGGFKVLDVRVPNERDNAATTKVDLQLPPGFVQASYQPVPGWSVKVTKEKLAKPIQTDDGPVDEQVSEIVWTADSKKDGIAPGQFTDFPLSVQIPDKAGTELTFKALQTYSNGEVVRWIGPPDADEPAPRVKVTAAEPEGGSAAPAAPAQPAASKDDSDSASKGLGIAALIVGALGLLAALVALGMSRGRGRSAA